MNEDRPTDLLSALPRTRPHRRSDKRGAPPGAGKPAGAEAPAAHEASAPREASAPEASAPRASAPKPSAPRATGRKTSARKPAARKTAPPAEKRLRQPAQPRGIPDARRAPKRKPARTAAPELVGTAVQAVGELAEIGLTLTARALRNAASRLPKP